MEPPEGALATLWSSFYFLPFFLGLLLLGIIKGALLFPFVCLIMTIGNSAIILGLWPAHAIWTYYCIARAKLIGPVMKIVLAIGVSIALAFWLPVSIVGSILAGAGYGFLGPTMATFDAVGEGKSNKLIHCFIDGTWSTIKGSFTVVRDLKDICFHSYFSIMDDLRLQDPENGKPYEIRLLYIPGAMVAGVVGIFIDLLVITFVATCKSPIMLFKGWKRLFHDLIGREGPFLETACVPFAGLAILLWPLAVVGAVVASTISSIFLGGYAAVVAYQESSLQMGLAYIVSSLSMFDEYSNDVLDMPEGSCFPSYQYRKKEVIRTSSFTRPSSFHQENKEVKPPPSHATSFKELKPQIKPLKLLDHLFLECKRHGENLIADGIITCKDIEESRSGKSSRILSIGLPAYSILQGLLNSANANSDGLVLSDGTEITSSNRPKDAIFDWFFEPLIVIKDQLIAKNLSKEEENYLSKIVLLHDYDERLKLFNSNLVQLDDREKAELDAFARRLRGITKSASRYPTAKRRFDALVKSLSEELEKKIGVTRANASRATLRTLSGSITRMLSQKSFGMTRSKSAIDSQV